VEFKATQFGLRQALEVGYNRIVLENNSLGLISNLHSRRKQMALSDLSVEEIRSLVGSCPSLLASRANTKVDIIPHLVARICSSDEEQLFFNNLHRGVVAIGELDLS